MLLAYLGPETMYPVASILTGIVGVFLMFGRNAVHFVRNMVSRVNPFSRPKPEPKLEPAPADQTS